MYVSLGDVLVVQHSAAHASQGAVGASHAAFSAKQERTSGGRRRGQQVGRTGLIMF